MTRALLGRKVGMTQVFDENGNVVPVTAILAGPCSVLQVKTRDQDGYDAVQLGFEEVKASRVKKPQAGHAKRWQSSPKRFVREVPVPDGVESKPGDTLLVDVFEGVESVDIQGISKGRGFAGVIKRWGFHGLGQTHGVKRRHRHGGSIGMCQDPGRVLKGKKMPGHYGAKRRTVRNLIVVKISKEKNLLLVKGSVPGANGGYLFIRSSKY